MMRMSQRALIPLVLTSGVLILNFMYAVNRNKFLSLSLEHFQSKFHFIGIYESHFLLFFMI